VHRATHDRLVSIDITIPDFQVKAAIRIGANPRLELNGRTLTTEVRQRHEVSGIAFLTLGEIELFHGALLPTVSIRIILYKYSLKRRRLASGEGLL
jgi:hypothetical protein